MATSPANHLLIAHSVDTAAQVQPFGSCRYETLICDSGVNGLQDRAFGFCRYAVPLVLVSDSYVNSPQGNTLRILLHRDVRGPPAVNSALLAAFALVSIRYGAIC